MGRPRTPPKPVAVIAGPGDGIGDAIARRCGTEGFLTILAAGDPERLEARCEAVRSAGGEAVGKALDLREEAEVEALFRSIDAEHGAPELVIHTPGAAYRSPTIETSSEMFEALWRHSCFGAFLIGRAAARSMLAMGRGTIMFSGAAASVRAGDGFSGFASAQFALRALAQSMARELGPKGIHVTHLIIDGVVDGSARSDGFPDRAGTVPPGGLIKPEAVADTCLRLHRQARSAWTFELDIRPFSEEF